MSEKVVLDFWFGQLSSEQHFKKDPKLDEDITKKFKTLHEQAVRCELFKWRKTAGGILAEIILIDQFSRNMYREQPQSFAYDGLALCLAQKKIEKGVDKNMSPQFKSFLYMPYMHSESQIIHEEAIKLFNQKGLEYNLEYEIKHKNIIDRFGRYPHRNAILGRPSTEDELEFLKDPAHSF